MRGWATKTIGELCDQGGGNVQTGPFGSQLHESDYSDTGTPVVMPTNILDGMIDETGIARVSELHIERLRRHKLTKGDIVYGRRGDIGRQALIREENVGWLCGTGCLRIRLGATEVLPEFLHHYLALSEITGWIEGQAIGSTMANLNTSILRRVPVRFPENVLTQRRIIAILEPYVRLIETNNKRIAVIDQLALEMYREWFVRRRFPGSTSSLSKNYPKGWEVKKLRSVLELCYGRALREDERISGNVPVYGSGGLVGTHNEALVKTASIIVGRKGNVGAVYYVGGEFFPIDTVFYVKSELPNTFLYFLLRTMNFVNNDAAVPGLSRAQAYANEFLLPARALILDFDRVVKPLFDLKGILTRQNDMLDISRNALLPRLFSGKLSVEHLAVQAQAEFMGTDTGEQPLTAHA